MLRIALLTLFTFSAALYISGCSTMDKDECQTADWRAIGYEDGSRGYHPSRMGEHREACAEYGIRPNMDAYRRGHSEGVRVYCKPRRGYRLGMRGAAYNDVCPPDLEEPFLAAYHYGKDIHHLRVELKNTNRQIEAAEADLHDIDHDIQHKEALLVDKHTPAIDRVRLLRDIKALSEDREHLEAELYALEEDRHALADEIKELKYNSPY